MSPYYFASAACCFCGQLFTFDPERVPSIPATADGVITPEGTSRPICADCMDKINRFRVDMGEDPIPILDGAYETTEGWPP